MDILPLDDTVHTTPEVPVRSNDDLEIPPPAPVRSNDDLEIPPPAPVRSNDDHEIPPPAPVRSNDDLEILPPAPVQSDEGMPFSPGPFHEVPGPQVILPSNATPLDFFSLVFGEETFQFIADGDGYNWFDTCKEELQQFLSVIIAMGVHHLPRLEDYWSGHPLLGAPGITSGMPRHRFKVLLRCLHLNDNTIAVPKGQPGFDKLHKLHPIIDIIRDNSLKLNKPGRQLSIDEAMVGFKGRSSLKQYMPNKPTKWGYKIWCICDAKTGYMPFFSIYTGAEEVTEFGLGEKVILTLASPYLDKAYILYFDNFFSSVRIAEILLSRNA